jgi:hypothetical protein
MEQSAEGSIWKEERKKGKKKGRKKGSFGIDPADYPTRPLWETESSIFCWL